MVQMRSPGVVARILLALLAMSVTLDGAGAAEPTAGSASAGLQVMDEPLFDLQAIEQELVNIEVISEEVRDGVIVRTLEFTGETRTDAEGRSEAVRVRGIMVLPEKGDALPGVLWCQGGMAPASTHMPTIYAKKGYACINITLPHDKYPAWAAFDASDPVNANLTRYGHLQMRAITVLLHEPRVDRDRIGVAGASYGGFFSTLVAGADPRVKAGASFFTGGYHNMGTNLPQFTKMPDQAAVDTWMRTIDPAWRHQHRDVPFLWTLPTNDNWFFFPAVAKTYEMARSKANVLAIIPGWTHGFPPEVDQQIFDWFDVHLTGKRETYIQPGPLQIESTDQGLRATWSTQGRKIRHAQLVVSPNAPGAEESPWLGQWVHRLHQPFAATVGDDGTAEAVVPVLDPRRPLLVYGNVTDERGVVTSTLPVLVSPPFPEGSPNGAGQWRGSPWGELEAENVVELKAMGHVHGRADDSVAHRGQGSLRLAAVTDVKQQTRPHIYKLFHVAHLPHRLTLAVRALEPVKLEVAVQAVPPSNWKTPAVQAIMGQQPSALPGAKTVVETTVTLSADWQVVTLDVPAAAEAIEGYNLSLRLVEPAAVNWWLDSVEFTPVAE